MATNDYTLKRRGAMHEFSEKRVRNTARRIAARMAYDAMVEKFNAVDPTDPALVEACQRLINELAQRAGRELDSSDSGDPTP